MTLLQKLKIEMIDKIEISQEIKKIILSGGRISFDYKAEITDWYSDISISKINGWSSKQTIEVKVGIHQSFPIDEIDQAIEYFVSHIDNIGYRQSLYQDEYGILDRIEADTEKVINDWYIKRFKK